MTLGRGSDNDVVIENSEASRNHVKFTRLQTTWQVEDLTTANGTKLNGEALTKAHMLETKDIVQVGDSKITFIRTNKDPQGMDVERAGIVREDDSLSRTLELHGLGRDMRQQLPALRIKVMGN